MSVEITHVRYGTNPKSDETISRYKYRNEQSGQVGETDKPSLVKWINENGTAHVGTGSNRATCVVVRPEAPYVRTVADNKYTNNLTSLPTF